MEDLDLFSGVIGSIILIHFFLYTLQLCTASERKASMVSVDAELISQIGQSIH